MDTAASQGGACDILHLQLLRSLVPSNSKHGQPFFLLNKGVDVTPTGLQQLKQGTSLQVQGERENIFLSFLFIFQKFFINSQRTRYTDYLAPRRCALLQPCTVSCAKKHLVILLAQASRKVSSLTLSTSWAKTDQAEDSWTLKKRGRN